MSWFLSLPNVPADPEGQQIAAAELPESMRSPEHDEQFQAAKDAAFAIIRSHAVGNPAGYNVHLSGHGNADHQPRQGWADDQITVTVQAVYKLPEPQA